MRKDSIELFQAIAKKNKGKCITKVYVSAHSKLILECVEGHRFEKVPYQLKAGEWCSTCKGTRKLTSIFEQKRYTEEINQIISTKNASRTDNQLVKSSTQKLSIHCKPHGIFKLTPNDIKSGTWCRACGIEKTSRARATPYLKIKKAVEAKKGILKTTEEEYNLRPQQALGIICDQGHPFSTSKNGILVKKTWCPNCAIKKNADAKRGDLKEYEKIIKARKGTLLSTEFKNNTTKLHIRCEFGHKWKVAAASIKGLGTWCPYCKHSSRSEKLCRAIFEYCFQASFDRCRPTWLRLEKFPLELDGYNEELEIAFEYQGPHHYRHSKTYKNYTNDQIEIVKRRDAFKRIQCQKRGIRLIVIPDLDKKLNRKDLSDFLVTKFQEKNITPLRQPDLSKINHDHLYRGDGEEYLERCRTIAAEKGGRLVSTSWQGARHKMLWECKNKHQWNTTYQCVVKQNAWCRKCHFKNKFQPE